MSDVSVVGCSVSRATVMGCGKLSAPYAYVVCSVSVWSCVSAPAHLSCVSAVD